MTPTPRPTKSIDFNTPWCPTISGNSKRAKVTEKTIARIVANV
jgi:hypothetical protein